MKKLIILVFSIWLLPLQVMAGTATITDVSVTRPPLKVSFHVKDAFSKDIEEAVKSGLPTSFNFIVEINRVNRLLPNENTGRWEFRHTVKYDSLRDEYEITLDETGERPVKIKDFGEVKRLMSSCSGVTIAPAHLKPGQEYELRIKAEMDPVELPFLFNYVFFFLELLDFETDWHVRPLPSQTYE
ncbi:MAG TPA: hypothetical protein DDW94_01310 [Deltaproteobacteria bacterium]|nr:MAG: hypothetical protein A2Z79_06680 [Deltaproteobacteria bacterium GWA2_55_82]OGQ63301.1 MAG: hypothetical protein A3I81_00920 [Deltaproteobacteria bacterium RIFCSPLOWO2_02_FULL_55_12]OIJ73137.1 MAG: hypothetical protein A2V21_301985 [Deltaproteobacteria bacterium GWC2_55_46]HBG45610.1 hypothetical protein [Deltaproteobacteria bacterium]HCY10441.1 hypothetical protein [Deltaproteobacteria bacterium]